MSNGIIDKAQLDAILAGPDDAKLNMAVECAWETRKAIDSIPDQIAVAIASQRTRDFRRVVAVCGAIAAIISLVTPYVISICR